MNIFELTDETKFTACVHDCLQGLLKDLRSVMKDYKKNRNTVSLEDYRSIVRYFLRRHNVPLANHKISFKGKNLKVEIPVQGFSFHRFVIKTDETSSSLHAITLSERTPEEQREHNIQEWKRNCKKHGLDPSDFGKIVKDHDGTEYEIIGCKSRVQSFPIKLRDLATGKTYVACAAKIKALIEIGDSHEIH